jgi:serine phosphatase RsbU (regulator of sigma subunit)
MDRLTPSRIPLIEWGVSTRAYPGQTESGDRHVVAPFEGGVLLAALDGLGHGDEAAAAARTAVAVVQEHRSGSVISIVRQCHRALLGTRGVVMSLGSVSAADQTLTWLGVGNVEGVLLRGDPAASPSREVLLLRGGVVGYQLPQLFATVLPIARGDVLVLATDGVRSDFIAGLSAADEAPQTMADRILAQHGKGEDDALVLVARLSGVGP